MAWKKLRDFFGKKKADGKRSKRGVHLVNEEDGRKFTALTPSGKGEKYAKELKDGKRITNSFSPKFDDEGKQMNLTKEQRAYRVGYLEARKDSAKAYNAKKGGKK